MIVTQCPKCSAQFRTQEKNIGLSVTCKQCQTRFEIQPEPEIELELIEEPSLPSSPSFPADPQAEVVDTPDVDTPAPLNKSADPSLSPSTTDEEAESATVKPLPAEFKSFEAHPEVGPAQEVNYEYSAYEKSLIPAPGWKQALYILGSVAFILGIISLVMGALPGGFLTDAGHDKRFILAAFIIILGTGCYIASSLKRVNAIVFSALFSIAIVTLAYFLPIYMTPSKDRSNNVKSFNLGPLKNTPKFPKAPKEEPEPE